MSDNNRALAAVRRIARTSGAVLVWLIAWTSLAHAHGGMAGPDEMGPPLFTAGALGFACYWLVILWPSRRRHDAGPKSDRGAEPKYVARTRERATEESVRAKPVLRLAKIAGEEQRRIRIRAGSGRDATNV